MDNPRLRASRMQRDMVKWRNMAIKAADRIIELGVGIIIPFKTFDQICIDVGFLSEQIVKDRGHYEHEKAIDQRYLARRAISRVGMYTSPAFKLTPIPGKPFYKVRERKGVVKSEIVKGEEI